MQRLDPSHTHFIKLNGGWNAEPNAPMPEIGLDCTTLVLTFYLTTFKPYNRGELRFSDCWRYRLGATNDEGWYRGQCRFSRRAPAWGEFYEVQGDLRLDRLPEGSWALLARSSPTNTRHFLFYLRDETFECDAADWEFRVTAGASDSQREGGTPA